MVLRLHSCDSKIPMRTIVAMLIGIVLLSARSSPERVTLPIVVANGVMLSTVRRASEIGVVWPSDVRDALLVQRPVGANAGARSSVFVVDASGDLLRRVVVEYGRTSASLIEVASGVSRGDRVVVSD